MEHDDGTCWHGTQTVGTAGGAVNNPRAPHSLYTGCVERLPTWDFSGTGTPCLSVADRDEELLLSSIELHPLERLVPPVRLSCGIFTEKVGIEFPVHYG